MSLWKNQKREIGTSLKSNSGAVLTPKLTSKDTLESKGYEDELESDDDSEGDSKGESYSEGEFDFDGHSDSGGHPDSKNILDYEGVHASEVGTSGVLTSEIDLAFKQYYKQV